VTPKIAQRIELITKKGPPSSRPICKNTGAQSKTQETRKKMRPTFTSAGTEIL
jgi:hypothetical protein